MSFKEGLGPVFPVAKGGNHPLLERLAKVGKMGIVLPAKETTTPVEILGDDAIKGIPMNCEERSAPPIFRNPARCSAMSGDPDRCTSGASDARSGILADVHEDWLH